MENTVIGVYDSYTQAQDALNELVAAGIPRGNIRLNANPEPAEAGKPEIEKHEHGAGHFFRSLFGMEDKSEHPHIYSEAVRRGSCVLTVDADSDEERDSAMTIMNRHAPVDIEERSLHWKSQGWTGYDENAPRLTEEEISQERSRYAQPPENLAAQQPGAGQASSRIPVVEEELKVGKREVERGGVRVFRHVRETPVHESVRLREEHLKVERHPLDQPATEADLAAFKEGEIEMREMAEEPVVEKTARVVEEVVVGKDVSERTEDIDDTVRRADVEVEQFGPDESADFQRHWQSSYGKAGGKYEDYDAAYRYGSTLVGTERFKDYRWDDAEPQIRSDWESSHPGSTWDKVKDAVRYGADRAKNAMRH